MDSSIEKRWFQDDLTASKAEELLQEGSSIETFAYPHTPLSFWMKKENSEMVRWLLSHGADPGSLSLFHSSLFMKFVIKRDFETLEMLFLNPRYSHIGTRYYWQQILQDDFEVVQELISRSLTNINQVLDRKDRTLFMIACLVCNEDQIKWLLSQGGNPHTTDVYGKNALFYACQSETTEIFDLIKRYVAVTTLDNRRRTVLHQACKRRWEVILEIVDHLLVEPGINIHQQDKDGYTALHFLAKRRIDNPFIWRLFLDCSHLDPNIQDNEGNTPLHWAHSRRYGEYDPDCPWERIVEMLEKHPKTNRKVLNKAGVIPCDMWEDSY